MIGPLAAPPACSLTSVNRRLGAAVLGIVAVLTLVACTEPGGDPTPVPTTPTPTATTPSPAPSSSRPPERPATMARDDVEGAIAAAQYFLELYPYAYNTGDLSEWRAMSHPECIFCASVIENVEELHADGGYKVGGELDFEAVTANPIEPSGSLYAVDFEVTQRASRDYAADGTTKGALEAKRYVMYTTVEAVIEGWKVVEVTPARLS